MWIVSGPTSMTPLCGDGMKAIGAGTGRRILPAPAL